MCDDDDLFGEILQIFLFGPIEVGIVSQDPNKFRVNQHFFKCKSKDHDCTINNTHTHSLLIKQHVNVKLNLSLTRITLPSPCFR